MDNYWKGKKVLVTGADGFIGSHLTERLVYEGAQVRAFAHYNSFGKWGWLDFLALDRIDALEIFPGDIRDPNRVREAVIDKEFVFHLASLIAIPYSYHAPDSYIQTNIGGALNVLNACHAEGVKKVIHTSTSEVYGSAIYVPIDEKHPLQGQSPYSASKIGADMLAESYYRSFGLPVTIARPFNTYGPRQSARAVIPTILSQLLKGEKIIKLGALHPSRDFNFVEDIVSGFLSIAFAEDVEGEVLNLGSGIEITIEDLVNLLLRITGASAEIVCENQRIRPEQSEVNRLLCDASKAEKLIGWKSKFSLEQGLKKTASWIDKNLHHFQTDKYTI